MVKSHACCFILTQEAKEGLRDEIAALEARLTTLKRRAGLDGERTNIEQMAVQHAVVRGILHQQHMMMAGAHAMLAKRLVSVCEIKTSAVRANTFHARV